MNPNSSFKTVSDFAISAKMVGDSPPEKRLKLEDANNHEQDEIRRLKEALKEQKAVMKEQKKMLASANKKLLEMEESKTKAESEKNKVDREKMKVEDEKAKLEDTKNKLEAKLRNLVECPVCLALPRKGPVPCCANGHLVCSPCLGKLREEAMLEQA